MPSSNFKELVLIASILGSSAQNMTLQCLLLQILISFFALAQDGVILSQGSSSNFYTPYFIIRHHLILMFHPLLPILDTGYSQIM